MSGQINCPAPLPEDTTDALLTEMLTPAPYKVPEKTKKAKGTRKSSRCQVLSDSSPITPRCTPPPKTRRKMKMLPLQSGETTKGRPPQPGARGEGSNKGRTLLPDYSTTVAEGEDEWMLRAKPLVKS